MIFFSNEKQINILVCNTYNKTDGKHTYEIMNKALLKPLMLTP